MRWSMRLSLGFNPKKLQNSCDMWNHSQCVNSRQEETCALERTHQNTKKSLILFRPKKTILHNKHNSIQYNSMSWNNTYYKKTTQHHITCSMFNIVWCDMLWCGVVRCNVRKRVWSSGCGGHGAVRCSVVWCFSFCLCALDFIPFSLFWKRNEGSRTGSRHHSTAMGEKLS